jgi:hypothetical protein
VRRPGSRGFMSKNEGNRGHAVPASIKFPHFGAHKYLIWLTLVRLADADLADQDRLSVAVVPQLCRLAAGWSGGRAVKLHMQIR